MADDFDDWVATLGPGDDSDRGGFTPGAAGFFREIFDERGPLTRAEVSAAWAQRQLDLAEQAVELFRADLLHTTSLEPPAFEFQLEDGSPRIAYRGRFATSTVIAITAPEVVREISDFMQDEVVGDLRSGWPMCPVHAVGAHAHVIDTRAVWYCRSFQHVVAPIGQLGR